MGSCCDCIASPLTTDEVRDEYVRNFNLTGDPRPPGYWSLPKCLFVPRGGGTSCYHYTGASVLRRQLKRCSCYPRPIEGTQRNTQERERALILTIPLTIHYEFGYLWGGVLHFILATTFLLLAIITGGNLVNYIVWGAQYILIYLLHVMPCFVQRLNRTELYTALREYYKSQEATTTTTDDP